MENNFDKLMQKKIISENLELSKMIDDIIPIIEQRYTNIELDANKKENFSLVVYKEQTLFTRFLNEISIVLEKFRIMKSLREFEVKKIENLNNNK